MRGISRTITVTAIAVIAALALATTAIGTSINFQAQLADEFGAPVADGSYSVTFSIYDDPTAGTMLWTETKSVTVTAGMMTTELGSSTPIGVDIFVSGDGQVVTPYLEIVFNGETFSPRTQLGAVPNAFVTQSVQGDFTSGPGIITLTPPGSARSFSRTSSAVYVRSLPDETNVEITGEDASSRYSTVSDDTSTVITRTDLGTDDYVSSRVTAEGAVFVRTTAGGTAIMDQLSYGVDGIDAIMDQSGVGIMDQMSLDAAKFSLIQDQMDDQIMDQMDVRAAGMDLSKDRIMDQIQDQLTMRASGINLIQDQIQDRIQDQLDISAEGFRVIQDQIDDQIQDQFGADTGGFWGTRTIMDQIQDQFGLGYEGLHGVIVDPIDDQIEVEYSIDEAGLTVTEAIQDQIQDQVQVMDDALEIQDQIQDQFGTITVEGLGFGDGVTEARTFNRAFQQGTHTAFYGADGLTITAGAVDGYVMTCDADGVGTWQPSGGSGSGDIDGVIAGTGLSGGGTSGTVTLNIAGGGVGATQLADNSITEPKLNITNSGTNGQVLTRNGTQFTWADDQTGTGGGGGWTDDGTSVRLTMVDDSVGIGTSSPVEKLHVDGNMYVSGKGTFGIGHTNSGLDAFVAGKNNAVGGSGSVISGGWDNTTTAHLNTVGGGHNNTAGTSQGTTIGGGGNNGATGLYGTVPGGMYNSAAGNYTFAAGYRAKANHDGCFVWGDATDANVTSTAANQFLIRASGGVGIGTTTPGADLDVNGTIAADGVVGGFADFGGGTFGSCDFGDLSTGSFQMSTGASWGYVLVCDGAGNGTWKPKDSALFVSGIVDQLKASSAAKDEKIQQLETEIAELRQALEQFIAESRAYRTERSEADANR